MYMYVCIIIPKCFSPYNVLRAVGAQSEDRATHPPISAVGTHLSPQEPSAPGLPLAPPLSPPLHSRQSQLETSLKHKKTALENLHGGRVLE